MSQYLNGKELFLDTNTTQYGSHMVMNNVHKSNKTKYINIDTKFRDEYNYRTNANYNITLPERITDVKTISVVNVEYPLSMYNISENRGNHCFKMTHVSDSSSVMIIVPDGQYTRYTLCDIINSQIIGATTNNQLRIQLDPSNHYCAQFYTTNGAAFTIDFAVNSDGNFDKYDFKSKLGWLLGFRQTTYSVSATTSTSEQFIDLNGPRYLYLSIDEFSKGNQHSFVSPLPSSLINKNIIARIAIDTGRDFSSIVTANRMVGTLLSDVRSFTGKIDIQKLNVQLLDENGTPVDLNGLDFSFCIEAVHE